MAFNGGSNPPPATVYMLNLKLEIMRAKKDVLSGITREECDSAFAEYADADAKEQKITAAMDEMITKIREKNQTSLQECADKKNHAMEIMQVFAMEHKDLFDKKRSIETAHGTFGFRFGTPALKTLKGYTWASVLNLLKEFLPDFVRTKEEPAKDLLLAAARDGKEDVTNKFCKCGLMVDQKETFFVDPKKEEALS